MYIPSIHYVTVTYIALHAHYKRFEKKKKNAWTYCIRVRACAFARRDKRVRVRMHGRACRDTYTYEYIYNNYIAIPKRTTATSTYEDHLKLLNKKKYKRDRRNGRKIK